MNPKDETVEGIQSLFNAGSEITGSATGAAIGFLVGGPFGAALGGACAPLLKRGIIKIGNDVAERFLSEQERTRIGGVLYYATIKIKRNVEAGKTVRADGFFNRAASGACAELPFVDRPSAEEILEGVLWQHRENLKKGK